jgi:DNA-binding LacI/PurR family transcriptional regulator
MATLKELAAASGVSIRTVARVLNNAPHIAPDKRRLVEKAVKKLGYTPNLLARGLKTSRKNLLGIIGSTLDVPVLTRKMSALQHQADHCGFRTMIGLTENVAEKEARFIREFAQFCDGLLFLNNPRSENLKMMKQQRVPYVLEDSLIPREPAVAIDRAAGIREALDACAGSYPQAIFLTSDPHPQEERRQAFKKGAGTAAAVICVPKQNAPGGYAAGDRVADLHSALVICYSDRMAAGLMRRLYELGARVPEDLGVVGFDDDEYAEFQYKPLSTVSQSVMELAEQALALLQATLDHKPIPLQTIIKTKFIDRESTL